MYAAASRILTWCFELDEKRPFDPLHDEPVKQEWVVHKFPIKGGTVIRAAMLTELFFKPVTWSTVEGKIMS